jgi:hypothetical protein
MDIRFPPASINLNTGNTVNTIYHNGGRTRIVIATVQCVVGANSGIGGTNATAQLFVGAITPSVGINETGFAGMNPAFTEGFFNLIGIIPPNYYYEVTVDNNNGDSNVFITTWDELDFTG